MRTLCLSIFLPNSSSHSRSFCNPANPHYQMWESFHLILSIATALPIFHPGPRSNISNGIFSFALPRQVVTWLACVLARQSDFQNTKDPQGLFTEAFNGN